MSIIQEGSPAFPKSKNVLIDTNVLYWLTYANSRVFPRNLKPKEYQLEKYPRLFEQLLENQNTIYFSSYSISELASIIARVEASLNGKGQEFERKSWLKKEGGREIVVRELSMVIQSIESWAGLLNTHPPMPPSDYLNVYSQLYLDGYDIYIQNEISQNNVKYLLTDDIDFMSVPHLNIITANPNASKYKVL
jgi:hypothetical protein